MITPIADTLEIVNRNNVYIRRTFLWHSIYGVKAVQPPVEVDLFTFYPTWV
jgi:hypothetical protein